MDHNHTNCCCSHHNKDQTRITRRWLFSLGFVLVFTLLIKPFMAEQLIKRADAYYSGGFYDDAIRQYKKATLLDKDDSEAWISLGNSFKAKNEAGKAIAAFREAVKNAPDDRAANFKLGMALAVSKDYKSAVVYLEKVRSLGAESKEQLLEDDFPYYRLSLNMLSLCFEKLQEFEKATKVWEEFEQARNSETSACER